jgi:plasmid stabilization system protein ParE
MNVIRHPERADDIRTIAIHYAEVSERVQVSFWKELDRVLFSIKRNPRMHHFDSCGLRRANFRKFPYHLLYQVDDDTIFMIALRHDRRDPDHALGRRMS